MVANIKYVLTLENDKGYEEFEKGQWVNLELQGGTTACGEIVSLTNDAVTLVEGDDEIEVILKNVADYF